MGVSWYGLLVCVARAWGRLGPLLLAGLAALGGLGMTIGAAAVVGAEDEAPAVLSVFPLPEATGVPPEAALDGSLAITFSEPVSLTAGALELACERSGSHDFMTAGDAVSFAFSSGRPFEAGEGCRATVRADWVSDLDEDDPPDGPQYDYSWSFRVAGAAVVINELDAVTAEGRGEFIELYDGGRGNADLGGLSVVLYRGDEASVYLAVGLDGYRTDEAGYFVIGDGGVAGADLALADGTLRDGPDGAAVFAAGASEFPRGAAVRTAGLLDAVVYGAAGAELAALLEPGQAPLDEGARGDARVDSSQRCPNGRGRPRETGAFVQNMPTPGTVNRCHFDESPRILAVNPPSGAARVTVDAAVEVVFSEPVTVTGDALELICTLSGRHTYAAVGDGNTYRFTPLEPFIRGETCRPYLFAERVRDDDSEDPPDHPAEDVSWSFTIVRPVAEVIINEVDSDTAGYDRGEFIELYDGGDGNAPLDGLAVVLFNGEDDSSYYVVRLDGYATDEQGYFVLGNEAVAGVDMEFPNGRLQNGPDAVAIVADEGGDYSTGTPVTATAAIDAVVYSRPAQFDAGLQPLLNSGESQLDEHGRGDSDAHSLQRCPNGAGGPRNTARYRANMSTPGFPNNCVTDTAPMVIAFAPIRDATGIGIHSSISVEFGEPVNMSGKWATIKCAVSGVHDYHVSSGPKSFIIQPTLPFAHTERCDVKIIGDHVTDRDTDDPPDAMTGKTSWSFSTADPPADFMLINESDADTPSTDMAEFIELFDGGTGHTSLAGLTLVLFNGNDDLSYRAIDLDGLTTNARGYFVVGNAAVQPDLLLTDGALQNGPDAVALYAGDATQFPNGSPITDHGLVDAVVYGDPEDVSPALFALLAAGQVSLDEGGRGTGDAHSLQRCPNGQGGQRRTSNFIPNNPTPGQPSNCITDAPPTIAATYPKDGAKNVSIYGGVSITFNEPVILEDDAIQLVCSFDDGQAIAISGGTQVYTISPAAPLPSNRLCRVQVKAGYIRDTDPDDPPDQMIEDFDWSFTTAAPPPEYIVLNEVDSDTPGNDTAEFIELYDGGLGKSDLSGLVVVFYDGKDDLSYHVVDLAGAETSDDGFLIIGNPGVPERTIEFPAGALQNGADAVAVYAGDAAGFPNGTPLHTRGLIDAVVYGTGDAEDGGLATLLLAGERQIDEAGGGASDLYSSGRCPDGAGDPRRTAAFRQNTPSPGVSNRCQIDEPPVVIKVDPHDGAIAADQSITIKVTFSEEVNTNGGWFAITCESSGQHTANTSGGPIQYSLTPDIPFDPREECRVTLLASAITDTDEDDPPDHPLSDFKWSFTTAYPPVDFVLINEIDTDTPARDTMEFIELYDGGIGITDLSGLVVVFWNGKDYMSYRAIELDGKHTNADGYFILGNTEISLADLVFPDSGLQNGPDAVGLYAGRAVDFPTGTPLTSEGLIDAIVYGPIADVDTGLLPLLVAGQTQVDEAGHGAGTVQSLQRCPNGTGAARRTETYRPDIPSPGGPNVCSAEVAPAVVEVLPGDGATGVGTDAAINVTFSEDVVPGEDWYTIQCPASGTHEVFVTGGPRTFTLSPVAPFAPGESCEIVIHGDSISDSDKDDPPDRMASDFVSSFSTRPAPVNHVLINETDADTSGVDKAEFIELYDGGVGNTELAGLVVVLWNGKDDSAYRAWDLSGYHTNNQGFFVLGDANVVPDLEIGRGSIQNGPDAIGLYLGVAADFPAGLLLTTEALVDAIVYGPAGAPDPELLTLLDTEQAQADEGGRGEADLHSLGRCPDGTGGVRRTDAFRPDLPTPGAANACTPPDEFPAIVAVSPIPAAQDVAVEAPIVVEFSEDVDLGADWYTILCDSGQHPATQSGGPRIYSLWPNTPFSHNENCAVTIRAAGVSDADADDPPDRMAADTTWTFHTAAEPPPPPVAGFSTNGPLWIGETADFSNHSSGPGPLVFLWDFGEGGPVSTEANPRHRYAAVGVYSVTLVVTGPTGTSAYSEAIEVRPRRVYLWIMGK